MASEPEIISPNDEVQMVPLSSFDPSTAAEISLQMEFAMKRPARSITAIRKELKELVTLDQSIAEESFYTLKRSDKDGKVKLIQGPSVRFAEVLCYSWGHVRWIKQISSIDSEFVTGEGVFVDLQRDNIGVVRTKRRITDKNGRRYSADMIQTTGNAASSLAYRNAVTGSIPKAFWNDILEEAKIVAVGGTASIAEKRVKALEYGAKIGVSEQQIFETLGVQGINDIGVDELIALKGLFNSLKDGETTIEEAFGDPYEKELNDLFDKLQYNKGRRDVLLGNYKGRSVDLLAYLRDQAKPLGEQKKTETPMEKPQQAVEEKPPVREKVVSEENKNQTPESDGEPKRGRGRPRKDTPTETVKEEDTTSSTTTTGSTVGGNSVETKKEETPTATQKVEEEASFNF